MQKQRQQRSTRSFMCTSISVRANHSRYVEFTQYIYTHTHILSWMNNETGMKLASFFTLENYSGILEVSVTGFVTGDYDRRFEKKLQSIPQSNLYSII